MRICHYRRCEKDISHRILQAKYCNRKCWYKEFLWREADKNMVKEKYKKCLWCQKVIALRLTFCTKEHQLLYYEFKSNFAEELKILKLKPKVIDTDKFKRIRYYLITN